MVNLFDLLYTTWVQHQSLDFFQMVVGHCSVHLHELQPFFPSPRLNPGQHVYKRREKKKKAVEKVVKEIFSSPLVAYFYSH